MKFISIFFAVIITGIIFFSCSKDFPFQTQTADITFNITFENIHGSESKAINSARIWISGTNDFSKEVILTVSGGYATGSTELEYGTYDFRVEMYEDANLKYLGEKISQPVDKNTTAIEISMKNAPYITITPTSLVFDDVLVNSYSDIKSFNLRGKFLTDNINVNFEADSTKIFEISKSSTSGFTTASLSFPAVSDSVNSIIYVRIKPLAAKQYNRHLCIESNNATGRYLNMTCNATQTSTPTINTNPTSLDFQNVTIDTYSLEKTLTVTAINLTANLTVTPPSGYEVSKTTGVGFTTSLLTYIPSSGSLNVTVFVRIRPVALVDYTGNIACASAGATTKNVEMLCTGIPASPFIDINPDSLAFGNVDLNTYSQVKLIEISASNLTANVTSTPPSGYEISKYETSGFVNSAIQFTQVSGTVNDTLFVRIRPAAAQVYSGNINFTSSGAVTKTAGMSCTGIIPSPTINIDPTSLDFENIALDSYSGEKTFTITASSLTANLTVTPPVGFEVSKTTNAGFVTNPSTLTFLPNSGAVNKLVYVRIRPTEVREYLGEISCASSGATSRTVSMIANCIATAPEITVTPETINFGNVPLDTYSTENSFILTGNNLISNLTVTPPAGYEISKTSGTAFVTTPLIFTPVSGSVSDTIYVKIRPATAQSYNSSINCVATNATARTVGLNCTGVLVPDISLVGSDINFGDVEVNSYSQIRSFGLTGRYLSGDISVTPPAGFEVSKSESAGYSTTAVTYSPSSGSVSDTVFVRIRPSGITVYSGNVSCSSTGAITKTLSLNCNGIQAVPLITTDPANIDFLNVNVNTYSIERTFTLIGSNLTANLTLTPPTGFEVSKTTGTGFVTSTLTFIPNSGSVNATVFIKIQPTEAREYSGNISLTSTGATAKNVGVLCMGIPEAPFVSATPSTINYGNVYLNVYSIEESFTLAGNNLTSDITVTPPANFEISKTAATGFTTASLTFTRVAGSVNAPVYVRIRPSAAQTYSGNIDIVSAGATSKTVGLNCIGTLQPLITLGTNNISFGNVQIDTYSNVESFTLTGRNLNEAITVTPPSGFEISKSQTIGWQSNSLTFIQTSGNVDATVYIKIMPSEVREYSGYINCWSSGALDKTVNLICTATAPPASITVTNGTGLYFEDTYVFNYSSEKSFDVTGTDLVGSLFVTPPSGYEISQTSGDGFTTATMEFIPASGSVNATIYVRIMPTAVTTYSGNIVCSSNYATSKNVPVNCLGIKKPVIYSNNYTLAFGDVTVGSYSFEYSFELSGYDLSNNVTVSTNGSTVYEISQYSGQDFSTNDIQFTPSGGNLSVTVYVRVKPTELQYYNEYLTCSSTGAEAINVTVTSQGTPPQGFALVEGGTFNMGITDYMQVDRYPQHSVSLSSFFISKFEVTQQEFLSTMSYNPSMNGGVSNPVENINWFEALVYCNWRSLGEGLSPCYRLKGSTYPSDWGSIPEYADTTWTNVVCDFNANGYRMPTEAEWEYAAKGGKYSGDHTYAGSDSLWTTGWYMGNASGNTHTVGELNPNELGLFDMSGNVFEYCWDWYDTNYYQFCYNIGTVTNPKGPVTGADKLGRGGSYNLYEQFCENTYRYTNMTYMRSQQFGLRVVRKY